MSQKGKGVAEVEGTAVMSCDGYVESSVGYVQD